MMFTLFVFFGFYFNNVCGDAVEDLITYWTNENDASACNLVANTYVGFCPSGVPVFPFSQADCNSLKDAYETKCNVKINDLFDIISVTLVFVLLSLCYIGGNILERFHFHYLPESGLSIIIGSLFGVSFQYFKPSNSKVSLHFDESLFFLLLLPPIIFEAGLNIQKKLLKNNIFTCLLFAIIGTTISTISIGLILQGFSSIGVISFGVSECYLFGALISSIDPIATLSVFNSVGVDPTLYVLVFGESILNDGVAVVLYDAIKGYITNPNENLTLGELVVQFIIVFFGSALIGFGCSLLNCLIFKYLPFKHSNIAEVALFFSLSYSSYYFAQGLQLSGIVSVLFSGIFNDVYTTKNLSKEAQEGCPVIAKFMSSITETSIFAYLGVELFSVNLSWNWSLNFIALFACLVGRLWVFPLAGFSNIFRPCIGRERISIGSTCMIFFSGLRGAVSFALAVSVPKFDSVLQSGSKYTEQLNSMTTFIILYFLFVHGGLTLPMLKLLNIPLGKDLMKASEEKSEKSMSFLGSFHSRYMLPIFTLHKSSSSITSTAKMDDLDASLMEHHE